MVQVGRFDINLPKVAGHKSLVLDIMWNPFNDNQIASASEDCKIKIWQIPDGGLSQNMTESVATLEGHQKKVIRSHAGCCRCSSRNSVVLVLL